MKITGNEDHSISLAQGSAWTANYRTANPGAIKGHAIGKKAIADILAQEDCVGIRAYYAINASNERQLVFVGIDADGSDLIDGLLADKTYNCPPDCVTDNSLNS